MVRSAQVKFPDKTVALSDPVVPNVDKFKCGQKTVDAKSVLGGVVEEWFKKNKESPVTAADVGEQFYVVL
jgi:hypothetical protein